jgi:peptidoglycan hydrolase CwlO-like protein
MSKRKTLLDKAIEHIEQKIVEHAAEIKALEFARDHLLDEQAAHQSHRDAADLAVAKQSPALKRVSTP